jgi:hypothetical protein
MEPAAELWECLHRVRFLRFVARSAGPTGWNGVGVGVVAVGSPTDSTLTFTESGSWRPEVGRETRFRNVFRWSLVGPRSVRLEHLRFGAEHPVYLFDLEAVGSSWSSVLPHLCREDSYSAELQVQKWGILLCWTVVGPGKQERIEYEYR